MRKNVLILLATVLLLTSCGTYTGTGAFVGGGFGSIIGSAIGGISGGHHGSHVGTLIGMAGGAIVGAAIGNAADQAEQRRYEEYQRDRDEHYARTDRHARVNRDTRTDDDAKPNQFEFRKADAVVNIVRNALFRDASGDQVLVAGEECTVTFEIMNKSRQEVFDIQPVVYELTGNKHIHISQNLHIESILPGKGIRYTATIRADKKLREGTARLRVGIVINNREVEGQTYEFVVPTKKK